MNHTKISAVAICVALSLAVAGCSNDEPTDAPDASSASSSTTQTSVDATTTTPTSSAVPAQGGVVTPKPPKEIGGTQLITGQGFTAQIQVNEPAIVEGRWGAALLTFPISINVESGALVASPDHLAVRTLNSDRGSQDLLIKVSKNCNTLVCSGIRIMCRTNSMEA